MTLSDEGPSGLRVNGRLRIPLTELHLSATRAGGPGGQHVNTSSTRVEVEWNVRESRSLLEPERTLLLAKLASRLDSRGTFRLVSAETRSQAQNRERVLDRLATVVRAALVVPKTRRKTKPTRASKEKRLDTKKRRSAVKRDRRQRSDD